MAVTQPIAGVTAGLQFAAGIQLVKNQRLGVLTSGFLASGIGYPTVGVGGGLIANFNFQPPGAYFPGSAVLFPFDGAQLVQPPQLDAGAAGTPTVSTKAQSIRPSGVAASAFGAAVAWPGYLRFNFTGAYTPPTALNVGMYFGAPAPILGNGWQNAQQWGNFTVKMTPDIRPAGIDSATFGASTRVADASKNGVWVPFDFTGLYAPTPWVNFPFGAGNKVHAWGTGQSAFGGPSVRNKRAALYPTGHDALSTGATLVSTKQLHFSAAVNFPFDQGYVRPNAANVGFYFAGGKQIDVPGTDTSMFGSATAMLKQRYIRPAGWQSSYVGYGASLDIRGYKIMPAGIPPGAFGRPTLPLAVSPFGWKSDVFYAGATVSNWNRYLRVYSMTGQPPPLGTPSVRNKTQVVVATGKPSGFTAGTARVSNKYRWLALSGWQNPQQWGNARVSLGKRYIGPAYIPGTQTDFGTPYVNYKRIRVYPNGYVHTVFGVHVVREREQKILPVAMPSTTKFGVPEVRDKAQKVSPFGHLSNEVGTPVVNLYKRYVRPTGWAEFDPERTRFGDYSDVRNRNRYIHADGSLMSWVSLGAGVFNKARAVYPAGKSQFLSGKAFIAWRVRRVYAAGWEEFYLTPYHALRNRKVISLDGWGWRDDVVPRPVRVWSNRQWVAPFSTYPQTSYGRPWVDRSPRIVTPSSIGLPPEGYPFVAYRVRNVLPAGFSHWMGTPALTIRWNRVVAWGYPMGDVGTPLRVYNKTPEIRPTGSAPDYGGRPTVALMRRYVRVSAGIAAPELVAPYVSFRTRKLWAFGIPAPLAGYPDVRFDQSQVTPPQQRILPLPVKRGTGAGNQESDETMAVAGGGGNDPGMANPRVYLNSVLGAGGINDNKFGEPKLRSMVIFQDRAVDSAITFGTARVLGGLQRVVNATAGTGWAVPNPSVRGAQLIHCGEVWVGEPYYHWVPQEFHSHGNAELIPPQWAPQTVGPVFGPRTTVTNKHRTIRVHNTYANYGEWFGRPRISTRPTYVRPTGFLSYKRGLHIVTGGGTKPIEHMGHQDSVFGYPHVSSPYRGPQWVRPTGFTADPGAPLVMHRHRRIYPSGWYGFVAGTPRYVGPYLRVYPAGTDMSQFSDTAFVAYRVRTVAQLPIVDATPVWIGARVKLQARAYFVEGTRFQTAFGKPDVGTGAKKVYPRGWEEFQTGFSYVPQYYPGLSSAHAKAFLAAPATYSTEFGHGSIAHR